MPVAMKILKGLKISTILFLHLGVRPCEIFPINTDLSVDVVIAQILFRQPLLLRFHALNYSVINRRLTKALWLL